MHTVLLFSGWEYQTREGQDMLGCPKEVYKLLPIKVKDSKQSSIITDLECIKAVGRTLYKGHEDLTYINDFLKRGVSGNTPLEEWKLYGDAVKRQFGKRKFIIWDDVPYEQ